MTMDNETADKTSQAKKICLHLQSQDRRLKKQTYIDLQDFLSNEELTDQELRNIYTETYMYFLNGLRDESEAVREQAIKFVNFLITQRLPLNDFYLTYIFPVLLERIGSVELIETSEEVRLQMVQLLRAIIIKYSNTIQLKPFLNDSTIVLCETVKDKYPAIKELSCQTIISLAKALPKDFHLQSETLLKPVLSCFTHQRYKIRVEAIKAVGEIIMHSTYKGVDEAVVPMAEKLFDQIPTVRQAVAQEASRWLLEHRDRYSYFHKMLPLILTGLNDEVENTRQEAHYLWEKIGLQYQKENEKDLKDKLDYLLELPKNYPSHMQRPNLGCRVLVQRNISKLAGALSNELTNWQEDVRVRCSQLLCSVALHAEEDLTFNLQNLLPAMYSAARDDDKRVVANIIQASEIIGLFVSFTTWSKLVIPVIEDGLHYGHLTVLAGLIEGAPKEHISEAIEQLSNLLAVDYICNSRKKKYQLELLKCIRVFMKKFTKDTNTGYNIFKIITSLISLKDPENVDVLTPNLYEELAQSLQLPTKTDVLIKYSNKLFNHINQEPKLWTPVTEQACIFLTLLAECDEAFGINLDTIADILSQVLDGETEAEMRLKTFFVLAKVFENKDVIFKQATDLNDFLEKLITNIFVPSLVWHAGATAEAIRTMSACCLKYALLPNGEVDLFASGHVLEELMRKMLPLLLSLMEDASSRSREVAIECVSLLKTHCVQKGVWWNDDLLKIYPDVLRRCDDPAEKVRLCALKNLQVIFENVPDEFLQPNFKAHRELIIDTLMVHFDDDNETVQILVLGILKVVARMNPSEMQGKIEIHRSLVANKKGCEEIVNFIQNDLI
ncbi:unnamed protein product [Ceutorhynchus assimilis]|uniref:HEAT repeat-containing protein 2 n=1 Tax=Ceutorhynchus assimilis TaxID=467358 RepID=A0A9N9MU16_9CUCU|nr:unnamed protein product [Ceutorhynchus assimilis]